MRRTFARTLAVLLLSGCVETTGGTLLAFTLAGGGDPLVVSGGPLAFTSPTLDGRKYQVTLTRARLHVGAVYLSQENPQNYTLESSCVRPGVYTGEVRGGLTLDALDPTPQPFPVAGVGTNRPTLSAELWLTGGELLASTDRTVVLAVAGTATLDTTDYPFEASFTISTNRLTPPRNSALPGSNPLCEKRIVAPVAFPGSLTDGSTVSLLVDPRAFFSTVDFAVLERVSDSPLLYRFTDDASSDRQPDKALFSAFRASTGPFRFEVSAP